MVWAASTVIAIGAGAAAVGGAAISANASSKASKAQQQASSDANATQLAQYNQTREDQTSWRSSGESALNRLNIGLGLDNAYAAPQQSEGNFDSNAYLRAHPEVNNKDLWSGSAYSHYQNGFGDFVGNDSYNRQLAASQNPQTNQGQAGFGDLTKQSTAFSKPFNFEADPGYAFREAEGMRGINNSAAARGGVLSGAALKAASKYNQNFASNEYGNSFNRYQTENTNQFNRDTTNQTNSFNRLASIAGVGQTAANQTASAGQNMANNVSQNQLGAGNAQASGYVGQANALNGAIGQGVNMYQQNQMMNSLSGYRSQNNAMSYANPYTTQGSDLNALNGAGSTYTGL